MKKVIHTAAAAMLLAAAVSADAAVTAQAGDLLAGFYKKSADGTSVVGNTYVINLGPASNYRESITAPGTVVATLGADLGSASGFGATWFSDPTVFWGIVGVVPNGSPVTGGDPGRTSYLSEAAPSGLESSAPFTLSNTKRGSAAGAIADFFSATNGLSENGAVNGGAFVPASTPNSFAASLPPNTTDFFTTAVNPTAAMNGSVSTLDLYRVLNSTSGADLTSAFTPASATVGASQYAGSFTLSSTGALTFVPEPGAATLGLLSAGLLLMRRRK